jgi:hypothetical protein
MAPATPDRCIMHRVRVIVHRPDEIFLCDKCNHWILPGMIIRAFATKEEAEIYEVVEG